jgi:hypothetical protein
MSERAVKVWTQQGEGNKHERCMERKKRLSM